MTNIQSSPALKSVIKNLKSLNSNEFCLAIQNESFLNALPLSAQEKKATIASFFSNIREKKVSDPLYTYWI